MGILASAAVTLLASSVSLTQDTLVVVADNAPVWGSSPQLIEEVRIGMVGGDDRYTFGLVAGVSATPQGEIWVSDRILGSVRRYSSDGLHLGDVGRKGEGLMYPVSASASSTVTDQESARSATVP